MAEKNVNVAAEETKSAKPATEKKAKAKKPNIFKKLGKFFKDTAGEMKKVVWTPKAEVSKNTKLVLATVVVVAVIIAVLDLGSSWLINSLAGLVG
jgi:preprotein translocase subunit SecE